MSSYRYNATRLIIEEFEELGLDKFVDIEVVRNAETISIPLPVDNGGTHKLLFISRDDDNDVSVRVYQIINGISQSKRARALEACNYVNCKFRHLKFCIDSDGDLNVEFDFPVRTEDGCVGEIACEMVKRFKDILDKAYSIFMKALYSNEPFENYEDD